MSGWRQHATTIVRVLCLGIACGIFLQASMIAQTSGEQIAEHSRRAEAALRAGDPQTATTEFKAILALEPKNAEASANLGVIAYRKGDLAEAKQRFEAALQSKPSLWDAQAFLGLIEARTGNPEGGDARLMAAFPHIRNDAVRIDAAVTIIQYHQERRTLGQVTNVIHDLEQSNADDPEVLYVVYRAYSELAASALNSLSKKAHGSGRVNQIMGEAAMASDDFPGAIARFRQAIQLDPGIPGIHYELGRAIITNSQDPTALHDAQQQFEAELRANPADFNSAYELGEIFRLTSDQPAAQKQFERALQLRPDFANAQLGLGEILMDDGKAAEAIPHLVEAVRLDPDNQTAHYRLARAYKAVGREQDATKEMLEVQRTHQPSSKTNHPPS